MEENQDFISPILDAAIALHELFLTLTAAGFNEYQALIIIGQYLKPTQ